MIKYAIMIGSDFNLSDWQLKCLNVLHENNDVELSLLIVNNGLNKRSFKVKNILFKIYRKLFFRSRSIKRSSVNNIINIHDISKVYCQTIKKGFSEYFENEDVEKVKNYDLDFILRFNFGIIRGSILSSSKYGVWSYHHGDELKYRGTPPGFWEIYDKNPVSGVILQKLTDKLDGGVILKKGFYKTVSHSYSKNLDNLYYNSSEFVSLVCKELKYLDESCFSKVSKTNAPIKYEPTNFEFVKFGMYVLQKKISLAKKLISFELWNVGVLNMTFEEVLEKGIDTSKLSWIKGLSKNEFIADPFQNNYDTSSFFAEYYHYKEDKGKLVNVNFDKTNKVGRINIIHETKFHLSYPYTLTENQTNYLIPESSSDGKQVIIPYERTKFMDEKVIIDKPLVDSTVIKFNNKYWLFCSIKKELPDTKLFLYYSDTIEGDWNAHVKNPIKIDVRSSRPGGDLFISNDNLFRVAQNCSKNYGGAISICKITKLDEFNFEEEVVQNINPMKPYKNGLHTLSRFGDKLLIDGKKDQFILQGFVNAISRRLK